MRVYEAACSVKLILCAYNTQTGEERTTTRVITNTSSTIGVLAGVWHPPPRPQLRGK